MSKTITQFQPSVNIVYDTGKPELFENFVPNINQIDIFTSILDEIINGNQKSHLMIGPYGAGKSMVGALVASIISARKNSKDVSNFIKNVQTVSSESAEILETVLSKKDIRWVPVTITGIYGDFKQIVIDSISSQLREREISFSLKGDGEQILKTISLWERDYPSTFRQLENYCLQHNIQVVDLLSKIKSGDEEYIIGFKKIYPHLTSGAVFLSEGNVSFKDQIEYLLTQLRSKKVGILLVYDEFGRFLQTVNQTDIFQTMQDLQDLAEYANRTNNMGLLFITHTGLRHYALSNNSLSKAELERVEKRFLDHRLESDPSIFYRSAFKILESARDEVVGNLFLVESFTYLKNEILKNNLFPDMAPSEIQGAILEGCQPIHPLTIRLLPPLSNILGQNDRTLYTFLLDSVKQSRVTDWYYADQLFDYFFPDESTFYLIEELRFYRKSLSYSISENAKRIVKLITLVKIVNQPFLITNSFLQFSLGLAEAAVEQAIDELKLTKLIRFNRFANSFELYNSSLVEVESLFNEYRKSIIINDQKRIDAINQVIKRKYYLPLAYNSDKSMTRYIEVKFTWKEQLTGLDATGDGIIAYILYRSNEEYVELKQILKAKKKENILFCVPVIDVEQLIEKIDIFIILSTLLENKELLQGDVNLKSEIETRIDNVKFDFNQLLLPLQQFDVKALSWIFKGEEIVSFTSREQLEVFLSKWMYERYPYTLEVRNEGFNKHNITSIQKKVSIQILEEILKPTFDGHFSISGFGPDYLIYATMFKYQGYDLSKIDQLENKEFQRMRNDLKAYVKENPRGKIQDLYQILIKPPYGMREPLVPILVVSLLKDYWNQMAFYANDFFVKNMNAQLLYQILEQKVYFYEYEIYKLKPTTILVLEKINNVFFEGKLPVQPVVLFNELTEWLRKLPRFTQITEQQEQVILDFKNAIRHSETDPIEATYRIEKSLNEQDSRLLKNWKIYLEGYLDSFTNSVQKEILLILSVNDWNEWTVENENIVKQSPIIKGIVKRAKQNEDWLSFLIEKTVGVKINDWSDITYDSFLSSVKQLLIETDEKEGLKILSGDQAIMEIKEVELSVKGKTIYTNLKRIVNAGGRTMSPDEVKFIVFKVLSELEK